MSIPWNQYIILPLFLILIGKMVIYLQEPSSAMQKVKTRLKFFENIVINEKVMPTKFNPDEIVIAAVAFGGVERFGELSTMMKSAILMMKKYHSDNVILLLVIKYNCNN